MPFTVLCVDDNLDICYSQAKIFQHHGYQVLIASTGSEALALARDADLVLLDVNLPDLSGFEVCRRIKADRLTGLVPVILMSGQFTRTEDKAEGLEGGGDVYLTKPVEPKVLMGQAKALLRIRQTELLLQEQAQIIDEIHDAVFAADLDGRVTRWNRGAEQLFGYTADEILGQDFRRLYPSPEGEAVFAQVLVQLHADGGFEGEKTMRTKSGVLRHVHSSFSLLGNYRGVLAYSVDVTEKKRLEEQFRQAQKLEAIGQLAGGVAHDFNNLMTIVLGYSDVLLGTMQSDDPQRGIVQHIKSAGERAASLTQQLLAFGRKQFLQTKILDLNELLRETEQEIRNAVGDKISLRIEPLASLSLVKADPRQILQVLANLTTNAREAMPNGGTLRISTQNVALDDEYIEVYPGQYVLLAVSDSGSGMDVATTSRVFEPFFSTKPMGMGSVGLGMATAYGIVKQSGGHIDLESERGIGTTVKVFLPRLAPR